MTNGLPMFPSPALVDRDGNVTSIQHGDLIEVVHDGNAMRLTYRRPDPSRPRVDDRLCVMDRCRPEELEYVHEIRGHQPVCPEYHEVFREVVGALLGLQVAYRPDLSRASPTVFLVWDTKIAPFPD